MYLADMIQVGQGPIQYIIQKSNLGQFLPLGTEQVRDATL